MQGTQYAPRESILCMEHFVALHRPFITEGLLMGPQESNQTKKTLKQTSVTTF